MVVGEMLGPYRVLAKLGEGGMGEVYRAHDTRLDRDVAIKVLPPEFAADLDRLHRFEQEARAASALNHPNILTVYDVGTHAGAPFLVTELLEGQTLTGRLHGSPLPSADTLEIGLQLADALETAHARGIIHRDIKPANIFVTTRGPVKLLDFGLAKVAEAPQATPDAATVAAERATEAGMTLGTVGYMSPEQVRGEVVDARTDLFSLGVVLYEATTGGPPFRGATSGAVLGEILTQTPTSPAQLNPEAPGELARIITKALEKDRNVRYQTARDLSVDLERLKRDRESGRAGMPGVAEAPHVPSLAVLPFANLSADKENEYFSDGLTEDIIDALAQVQGLRVMARTSAFAFRGREVDVRAIGARLNVDHILEGSVRRAGSRIRVTAQLVSAKDGYHLWSQRFDREMTDVFAIQDEISQAIVEKLRVRLSAERPPVKRYTENLAAYDLCLKARHHLLEMTQEGREAGRRYCEQAIALDPNYAMAYVVMAECYLWSLYWGSTEPRTSFPRAKAAALEALRLDDSIADAHIVLGTVLGSGEFDWRGAEREFRLAQDLSPSSAVVRYDYAWCYAMWFLYPLGRVEEAVTEIRRALERDPLDPFYNSLLGYLLHSARRFEAAIAQLHHAIELAPSFFFAYWFLSATYAMNGSLAEAFTAAKRANELSAGHALTLGSLGSNCGRIGLAAEARQVLEELVERRRSTYVPASALAWAHFGVGDQHESREWIARGIDERDPIIVTALKSAPIYDGLRLHPRFPDLLRKMNLEP